MYKYVYVGIALLLKDLSRILKYRMIKSHTYLTHSVYLKHIEYHYLKLHLLTLQFQLL